MLAEYEAFLDRKRQLPDGGGFAPSFRPDFLFDFQRHLVEWAVRRGRAAVFADCGLGKTPMQLVWAENVVRQTNRPVLILTPLAVAAQTCREGEKFGVECVHSRDGKYPAGARVVATNYEQLHRFRPDDFAGVVCDESSMLKNFDGTRKAAVTEFMRTRPYRLLCTATAAPNDYPELGTSAEALGELGFNDMLTMFFRKEKQGGFRAWAREKHTLKPHAERDFWRWVCSWARAVRRPSDLGFDDGPFQLPTLTTTEHVVRSRTLKPGSLFATAAVTLAEQKEERRRTLAERCEKAAALVADTGRPAVCWCHLNDEGDLLEMSIPGAVQVSGRDKDEAKEEKLAAFAAGQVRVLVTKPTLAGFGLNWQHCAHQTYFPSHSFEQFYQAVRRSWRFGQTNPVTVDVVTSEGEAGVLANLNRKSQQADALFARLVELMGDQLRVRTAKPFPLPAETPTWLSSISA